MPYKSRSCKPGGDSNPKKPRNINNNNPGYGNCKSDGQFYNRQKHDDDDSNNGLGGNKISSNRNQANLGSNRTNNNGNNSNNGQKQQSGYRSYLIMPAEEKFEQSSSAFNEVFIDDDKQSVLCISSAKRKNRQKLRLHGLEAGKRIDIF